MQKFAEKNHKSIKGFTPQAFDCLLRYSWPGNVRELENAVERAVILCRGDLISEDVLPRSAAKPAHEEETFAMSGLSLDMLEKRAIEATLKDTGDNKSEAARRLGITRATLHNKLRKYGIE